MLGIKLLRPSFPVLFLFIMPTVVFAQVEVSSVQWTNAQTFKFCSEGSCETFRNIKLSKNSIALGENISIVNAQTGVMISSISVRSIKYGRQVKMCWLGDNDGQSGTYITVGGCKM
tara:strand:+ start:1839 stop:2186 length:348 start_codon:yes stop_codon:yes gene_type:complete